MIITRPNYKKAFLAFAANGTVNLNKKTIGLWMMVNSGKGFHPAYDNTKRFKAKVHLNRDRMTVLYGNNKYQLMRRIAENIEDAMLTRQ